MSERRYRNPQVNLRLPEDLKEKISTLAESNKRSANAEMVAAIEDWVNRKAPDDFKNKSHFLAIAEGEISEDDRLKGVSMTKESLKNLVNTAAENAVKRAIDTLFEEYDLTKKSAD